MLTDKHDNETLTMKLRSKLLNKSTHSFFNSVIADVPDIVETLNKSNSRVDYLLIELSPSGSLFIAGLNYERHYHENGIIKSERWLKHFKPHREGNEPAVVRYNEDGDVINKEWFKNGIRNPPSTGF